MYNKAAGKGFIYGNASTIAEIKESFENEIFLVIMHKTTMLFLCTYTKSHTFGKKFPKTCDFLHINCYLYSEG